QARQILEREVSGQPLRDRLERQMGIFQGSPSLTAEYRSREPGPDVLQPRLRSAVIAVRVDAATCVTVRRRPARVARAGGPGRLIAGGRRLPETGHGLPEAVEPLRRLGDARHGAGVGT